MMRAFSLAAVVLVAIVACCPNGWAADVNFILDVVPPIDGNFNDGSNWSDGNVPSADFDSHFVQDDLTANFFGGSTSVHFLTIGDTSFGRLNMTGGALEVIASDQFEVGESVGGEGEVIMTGTSTLTAAGAVIGTRSKGMLSIGPDAVVDLVEDTSARDLRVGSFGPAFVPGGPPEPGLDGDGLVDVQGTLNAATVILSQSGAKGELRLSGGTVNLAGGILMDLCEGCGTDPGLLAMRSAKVSIVGSSGEFNVNGGILAATPTAAFSFTADANGVTPIFAEISTVDFDTAKLELDLDAFAFTSSSTMTLIDAFFIFGRFDVSFLGNTMADVNYDEFNGDVFLDNFRRAVDGDFNNDGLWDCDDINALSAAVASSSTDLSFDMNGDGVIDGADITGAGDGWLAVGGANNIAQTGGNAFLNGDANLSGAVDGSDFGIWNMNKFTTNSAWCSGNFNADNSVDGSDFGIWNTAKFTSSANAAGVPEPALAGWMVAILWCRGFATFRAQTHGAWWLKTGAPAWGPAP